MASPTSSPRKAVIFGGHGFIGSYVADAFVEEGFEVIVVGRTTPEPEFAHTSVIARIDQLSLFERELSNADVVVCLASSTLPATANSNIAADLDSNVRPTIALAERCAELGVGTFLFASSGGTVYGEGASVDIIEETPLRPINGYGASKVAIENYLRVLSRMTSMKSLSLRISNPFGLGQDPRRKQGFVAAAVYAVLSGEPLTIWGDGSVIRDYVHVTDVAKAFIRAAEYVGDHSEFNIGSGSGLTLLEVIDEVSLAFACDMRVNFESGRPFDIPANVLNVDRASSELSWSPEVKMPDALEEMAHAISQYGLL